MASRLRRPGVRVFDVVGSTNDVARRLAAEGAPSGTIVVARRQTAGRGRAGRPWRSPAGGGVYLSMLLRPPVAGPPPPLATVVAGIDLARALNRRWPGLDARVKWPNDLMARDLKLAGVLAEAGSGGGPGAQPEGRPWLVVGVGVNLDAALLPPDVRGAAGMVQCVGPVDADEVAEAVVEGLERRLPNLPAALDEAALREARELDWLLNRPVEHLLPGRAPAAGVAAGMAPDGALLLRAPRDGSAPEAPPREEPTRVVAGSIAALA